MTEPRDQACVTFGAQLTAYLDGELDGELVSAVRGHLRECTHCRVAADELAVLRDGLRTLAPVDPPASLWAGVQAQLAAQEVADAHRPSWRRALARWRPALPRFGGLAFATAAAAVALWWHAGRNVGDATTPEIAITMTVTPPVAPAVPPAVPIASVCGNTPTPAPAPIGTEVDDTTADVAVALAAEPARTTARYTAAVDELLGLACGARATWSDTHRTAFDTAVGKLRAEVAASAPGRTRDHAWRALVRYLQDTVVHDEVAAIEQDRGAMAGTRGLS